MAITVAAGYNIPAMTAALRSDALLFYAVATTSLLESAVSVTVERLGSLFADDPAVRRWLVDVWLPDELAHGRMTRSYVEDVWPEFKWVPAFAEFLVRYEPRRAAERWHPSLAMEALARCVTESEAAMFYHCLGSYTTDPALRALFQRMRTDEERHYEYFSELFDRYQAQARVGVLARLRAVLKRSAGLRDEDLACSFAPLNAHWAGPKPFAELTYRQYLERAGWLIRQFLPKDDVARMLYGPVRTATFVDRPLAAMLSVMVRRQYPNAA